MQIWRLNLSRSGGNLIADSGLIWSGLVGALSGLHFGVAGHGDLTRYAPPRVVSTNVNFFLPSVSW